MNLTQIFIVAIIVIVLVYDMLTQKLQQPTESTVLRNWARDWTLLPFCGGFLVGHWWAPRQHVNFGAWGNGLAIMLALLSLDIYWNLKKKPPVWWRYPALWALIGIPCGSFLWGLRVDWAPF